MERCKFRCKSHIYISFYIYDRCKYQLYSNERYKFGIPSILHLNFKDGYPFCLVWHGKVVNEKENEATLLQGFNTNFILNPTLFIQTQRCVIDIPFYRASLDKRWLWDPTLRALQSPSTQSPRSKTAAALMPVPGFSKWHPLSLLVRTQKRRGIIYLRTLISLHSGSPFLATSSHAIKWPRDRYTKLNLMEEHRIKSFRKLMEEQHITSFRKAKDLRDNHHIISKHVCPRIRSTIPSQARRCLIPKNKKIKK